MHKKGFTLIEVLISASIFSVIFLIGTQSYITAVKQSFFSTSNTVFDNQIQIFINRLDNIIEGQTINLNEYFVQCHKAGDCPFYGDELDLQDMENFGKNESLYYHQFFDLGTSENGNPDGVSFDCTNNDCSLGLGVINSSKDTFLGRFGDNPNTNAFCNFDGDGFLIQDKSLDQFESFPSLADCDGKNLEFSVLFLKSKDDSSQTIIANTKGDLVQEILSNKTNTFLDDGTPTYFSEFQEDVNFQTLGESQNIINFQNLKIENFKVNISPIEDPNFAFAENNSNLLLAPKIEISFKVGQKDSSNLFKLFEKEILIHKIYSL